MEAGSANKASGSPKHESMCYAIALADILSYMEDCKYDQSVAPVFPMPEIILKYVLWQTKAAGNWSSFHYSQHETKRQNSGYCNRSTSP